MHAISQYLMYILDTTSWNLIEDPLTESLLYVNLTGTHTPDYHLESCHQRYIFQQKTDEIFKDLPNIFGIAHGILIVKYDADDRVHDRTLKQVMQIWYQEILKLNTNTCQIKCIKIPFFWEVISREVVQPDPKKLNVLTEMLLITKNNCNHLRYTKYLRKLLPSTAELC